MKEREGEVATKTYHTNITKVRFNRSCWVNFGSKQGGIQNCSIGGGPTITSYRADTEEMPVSKLIRVQHYIYFLCKIEMGMGPAPLRVHWLHSPDDFGRFPFVRAGQPDRSVRKRNVPI